MQASFPFPTGDFPTLEDLLLWAFSFVQALDKHLSAP